MFLKPINELKDLSTLWIRAKGYISELNRDMGTITS